MWWILAYVLLACLAIEILGHLAAVWLALPKFEIRPRFSAATYPPVLKTRDFSVVTSNGLQLVAGHFSSGPHPRGLVLFCHEMGSDRWSAQWYCDGLLAAGFDVVSFDFRNHGESDHLPGYIPIHWLTRFETDDVAAVLRAVLADSRFDDLPIALYGISRGGCAAIVCAADTPRVQCVIADGAYSVRTMFFHYLDRWGELYVPPWLLRRIPRWHLLPTIALMQGVSQFRGGFRLVNVEAALRRLSNKPLLMISGERDSYITPSITSQLFAILKQPEERKWIVPGAKHNLGREVLGTEYDARLVSFLNRHLRAEARAPRGAVSRPHIAPAANRAAN